MSAADGARQYAAAQIGSVDRSQLLLLVLEGGLRFLRRARAALVAGELEQFGAQLARAQAVIAELLLTLDHAAGGPLARDLAGLYTFMLLHLMRANAERSVERVDEVLAAFAPIVEAFREVVRSPGPALTR
jgi:flagellar protein FliS